MLRFLTRFLGGTGSSRTMTELEQANRKLAEEVADRKRAEQALRESGERLSLALRSAGVGTWSRNIRTDEVIWDDHTHSLFGLQPGTFPGRYGAFLEAVHPDDRDRVASEIDVCVDEGAEYDTEYRVVWPDESVHHIAARGRVHRDQDGQPLRMTGVCWDVTEHAKAEQALKDSQALYSSLVESLPVHVTRKDLDGRITFVNQMFCKLLGKQPEEILGKTDFDFYPAELAEKYRHDDRQIVETGGVFEDIEENRTGAELNYFHVLKSPVPDASGTIVGTQAVFWDVTKRKLAEAALDQQRYLLHMLMDRLPDAIYFKDRASRFTRISKALADRFGLDDPAEAVGKSDSDFFSQQYAERAFADEQELMRSGRSLVGKVERPRWPDGQESWVSTTKVPLHDKEGQIVGTFGISRDITEQKWAEEALRESERRTRLIIDTARDAFVAMNADGVITDWNAQAEITFGWSREEALGQKLSETVIPPQHRDTHREGIKRFLATGEGPMLNERIEITALHRDGHEFPVELTISPLRLNDAYIFNAFIHDITQRRRAAEAMQQAKEAAEAASRAKSDFLANMSHEIRTPMNAVLGMTELVLDTQLSSQQRENLTMVQESAESLLSLINDVLDFSKIEAGKLSLDRAKIDLRDCLGDTMKLLAPRAYRDDLELVCHIAPDVPDTLVGDPSRLRQIIVNLVGNAVKFTEHGEVLLDVRCESQSEDEVVLHFAVSDTGVGIPEEKLAFIFEAFEQADTSTTRRFAGTGLGLAISSTLVELMGGRISVESEVDRGSTFHFTARFGLAPTATADVRPVESSMLEGTRVLVVDDNATNRRILEETLDSWEMEPKTVAGAEEALEQLRHAWRSDQPFPLVVTDVNMPGVDGFTLVERIKQDEDLSSTIIMMLTSGDRPGDIARCEELGVAAYLMKPIKQSELFDAVLLALGVTEAKNGAGETVAPEAASQVGPLRVLLAEDSLPNQKLAVGLLEKRGHTVTVANNGREAVAAAASGQFDLVLMDVQMPEMDGLEATAVIRSRERQTGRHTPIVAMTAHALKGDREQCLAAGMDEYVAKPVRSKQLYEAIERVLAAAAETETPAETPSEKTGDVNWQLALQTALGDRKLLKDVAEAFLEECPGLLHQLEEAIRNADAATVQRSGHTIKGAMRTFGANTARDLAGRIEEIGRSGKLDDAFAVFDVLKQKLQAIRQELEAFRLTD